MAINFFNEDVDFALRGKRKVATWIRSVIKDEKCEPGDIAFIFCSPDKHLDINKQYLGHDYPTDVITFDYCDDFPPHDGKKVISGDIFIDPATVAQNAEKYSASLEDEIHRVLVHGVLHLCGHDDQSEADRKQMRILEDLYLIKRG
jgi:rRNA maturation RNase YbeY